MTWTEIYLLCFWVGFFLSALAWLGGAHLHLPGLHHAGGLHHGGYGHHGHHAGSGQVSPFNFGTLAAFLAWFGGTGYLLTRYYSFWFWLVFFLATAGGLTGAAIVFWFLAKVLLAHEQDLNSADYSMIGVLGRVSSPIRDGGTGEMIFSQAGTRRAAGARSEDGTAIPKGIEVVVTRYEKGIAYVQRWEDLTRTG